MGTYNNIDMGITSDGDLFITNGDLGIVRDRTKILINGVFRNKTLCTALKRDILKRLATDPGEYLESETLSANLQRFKGKKLSPYLLSSMEESIIRALTIDGRVDPNDLKVVCMAIDDSSVMIFIFIEVDGEEINLTPDVLFSMEDGVTIT